MPLILVLLSLVLGTGCTPSSTAPKRSADGGEGPVSVVATVGMVADLVRNVGGDHVDVSQIMGAGVDPHLYKTTRDDVRLITTADIVFYSGLMLEGKMSDTLIKVARNKPVVAVTEQLEEAQLLEPEAMEGHFDPHVWMDVSVWSNGVDVIAEALAEYDPTHAEDYRANAESYKKDLSALHQYGLEAIGSIPEESRILVTSHDAFNYFGRAYGLDVQGVQGLSTESEAGLQRINQLVDLLVQKQVRAVFVESSVPRKNIDSLIEGARAKGHDVRVGGAVF